MTRTLSGMSLSVAAQLFPAQIDDNEVDPCSVGSRMPAALALSNVRLTGRSSTDTVQPLDPTAGTLAARTSHSVAGVLVAASNLYVDTVHGVLMSCGVPFVFSVPRGSSLPAVGARLSVVAEMSVDYWAWALVNFGEGFDYERLWTLASVALYEATPAGQESERGEPSVRWRPCPGLNRVDVYGDVLRTFVVELEQPGGR